MKSFNLLFLGLSIVLLVTACQPEAENKKGKTAANLFTSDSLELHNAWLRPGSEGGNSAAYLQIYNGTNHTDTLLSVESTIAAKTGVHETFHKKGLIGMRPAGAQAIAPDSVLKLQPGGIHIMLMKLHKPLAEGDSVLLQMKFSSAGKQEIMVPVKQAN